MNESTADVLFEPLRIKSLELPNRLVMAPMSRCFCPGGVPTQDTADYYRRRAEGGVGLIVTEGTWVPHRSASNDDNIPRFYGDDALAGWSNVVDTVHAAGGRIFPQIWHVGLTAKPELEDIAYVTPDDPSTKVSPSGWREGAEHIGQPMTERDIEEVIAAFVTAARTAQTLGFDGVELHGAHGYLIDQFFWPQTNRREDRYGGSLAARARFAAEIIAGIRAAVGPTFPIAMRISQWKPSNYAAKNAETPAELEELLSPIAEAGLDIFHCSQRRFWEPEFEGSSLNLAGWVKKLTGRTTVTVGSVGLDGDFMANWTSSDKVSVARLDQLLERLEQGEFDLVAVGRALLADPLWVDKIKHNRADELRTYDPKSILTLY